MGNVESPKLVSAAFDGYAAFHGQQGLEYGRWLGFAQAEGLAVGSRQPAADGPAEAEKATNPGTTYTLPVCLLLSVALPLQTRYVVFFNISLPALRYFALSLLVFERESFSQY